MSSFGYSDVGTYTCSITISKSFPLRITNSIRYTISNSKWKTFWHCNTTLYALTSEYPEEVIELFYKQKDEALNQLKIARHQDHYVRFQLQSR